MFGLGKSQAINVQVKSEPLQSLMHQIKELVTQHDERVYAYTKALQELVASRNNTRVPATVFAVNDALGYREGAAQELEKFYARLQQVIAERREQNRQFL
jgi:hypothetical protein